MITNLIGWTGDTVNISFSVPSASSVSVFLDFFACQTPISH